MKIDSQDVKILKLLQENSRISQKRIAELLSLSRPTVKSKIEKLLNSGIIERFTVKLGREALEENITLFISTNSLDERALAMEEVAEAYRVSGENAFLLKAATGDMEGVRELIEKLEELYGEVKVEIALENLKHEEEKPGLKAEYICEYCGSTSLDPKVFKHRNVEHYFCCPVCLKNFRRAIRERG